MAPLSVDASLYSNMCIMYDLASDQSKVLVENLNKFLNDHHNEKYNMKQ